MIVDVSNLCDDRVVRVDNDPRASTVDATRCSTALETAHDTLVTR